MANDTTRDNRGQPKNAARMSGSSPAPKKKHAPRWRLLSLLAILAAVVWFLPTIIVQTPLLPWILKLATTDLKGTATVQSASLGWLSPIEVYGIEMKDAAGKPVLSVGAVRGDRSLGAILFNYTNLGKFTIYGTKLSVAMRDDGTNLEDMLAKYLVPSEKPASSPIKIGVAVEIIDGVASVTDERTGLTWQIEKLSLKFGMAADGETNVDVITDLRDIRGVGKLSAGVKMCAAENSAKFSLTQFPLAMLRPLAARFSPGTTLTGRLSSEVGLAWGSNTAGKNGFAAKLDVDGFSLGAGFLHNDVLQLANLHAECQASWQADRFDIQKSLIQCDVGSASLTGTVPLGGKDGVSLTSIAHQRQECAGAVDLARLAQMLPSTLSLRPEMRIDSGRVEWTFTSLPGPQGAAWHGQVVAANLTATNTRTNRQIAWNNPISAVFDAHDVAGGEPIVDRLLCQSDFLNVEGGGTTDNLNAKFSLSLNKLADQLGQFIDFGNVQFAGDGSGNLAWKRSPQHEFDAGADIKLTGFQLQMANDQPAWREDVLLGYMTAKGQTNFDANTRIDTATLTVKSGIDQIDLRLLGQVKDLRGGGVWPLGFQMQGNLQNWPARLAPWLPMKRVQLTGDFNLQADGIASKDGAELRQMGLAVQPLIANSPWANINETRLEASASACSWNQSKRRLQLPSAMLKCATAAVQADNIVMALPAEGSMELAGNLNYEGNIGRIRQWFVEPKPKVPVTWTAAGQLKGSAVLKQTAGIVQGTTTAEIVNLAITDAGKKIQEPRIQLVAQGNFDPKSQTLQLSQCQLISSALTAAVAGGMAPVNNRNSGQFEANLNYDLERLTGLLRPCIGSDIRVAGRGSTSAQYRGPFSLAEGAAAAAFRWEGAQLYGFPLGPADIKATMANGVAQIEPLDLAVSGGRVRLAPQVQLAKNPMVLTLPKGPLVQKVQINPAMCGSLLQYIAPALAGVATAEGAFSIDLDDCRVPLTDLKKANITGRFTVHSVRIGPGPMIRELAVFMNRAAPAQLKRESVVPFQMVDGRVHHKNLELIFPDITIRTEGWVDLDQRMEITAQMPVPQKWQAGTTVLANAVRNQIITVPLRGPLAKPALDPKVVQELSRQFIQKAASNVIEGELNRLFTPKK